jgi:threonine dehydrogenase-like Zn-dependent dehydrogenase
MDALVLEDVKTFRLRQVPNPIPKDHEILVKVGAVGVCGTDLHIFHGFANYRKDDRARPIPLR